MRWSRGVSVCSAAAEAGAGAGTGTGAGLDRGLGIASAPVAVPVLAPAARSVPVPVLVFVLSGRELQGSSGRRDGKKRRGGMPIAFKGGGNGGAEVDVVCAAESSASASPEVVPLWPSRPVERRREVKSVKSTVRERAGTRRMDGWRVRGGAEGAAVGPQASGEASRRVPQFSRRVERSMWRRCGGGEERWTSVVAALWSSGPLRRRGQSMKGGQKRRTQARLICVRVV